MQHVPPPSPLNALHDWNVTAARGDSYVYFRGFLARAANYDLGLPVDHRDSKWREAKEAADLRDMAYALHERDEVRLVQRRLGPLDYEYIAQRI
ncbi:MAG: hypothetical protein EA385_12875 [Salinarimonadaceae bacterium]|nr:MAG: hypothetical protein EA385_12875 [Salinarimonadaceae bacterium]